jgi:hypothetical protein
MVRIRRLISMAAMIAVLILAPAAAADIGIGVETRVVDVGGRLRGWSNGSGFPVYIVPAALAPGRHSCHGGTAICEPTSRHAPRKPFVRLGRVPGRRGDYARHRFSFRVPRVRPGLYRVFVYCQPCGGSLIQSGGRPEGETIRVRP